MDVFKVILSERAKRNLLKVPLHIVRKLQTWVNEVEDVGLNAIKKIPGYHDEPLKGIRVGQRSIRLSKAYRAIYRIDKEGQVEIAYILEVNKHDY